MKTTAILHLMLSSALLAASAESFPTSRDPLQWPFAQNSIWNLPLGSEAVYVFAGYKGTLKPLRMGSLLALPPRVDINSLGLQLEASAKIARALQDYGAYIVDDPVASA